MKHVDPFSIKKFSKFHPKRLAFTAKARLLEIEARNNFSKNALPIKVLQNLPSIDNGFINFDNTDVTPLQMQHLIDAVRSTEKMVDTVIVEVGCFRGVTTSTIASATSRQVIAVDPFIGYGGSDLDFTFFRKNTINLTNIIHERVTSGEASRTWKYGPVSLVFIDAVHDYVNTVFDVESWSSHLIKGGILAMHDTDQLRFSGTRKAAFEFSQVNTLISHPDNLSIFSKTY